MQIGTTLRRVRIQKRMSQAYLADLVGVSQGTISNWESDAHYPDVQELTQLATVLDVSVAVFLVVPSGSSSDQLASENTQLKAQNQQLTQQLAESLKTISQQHTLLATYLPGGGKN